jgi:signal transduction histidine kinase
VSRLVAATVLAWLAAVAVVAVTDTPGDGALTGALLLAVAVPALGAARLARRWRAALGSLERQLGIGVAIAAAQAVAGAVLFAAVMFLSAHDALLVCLVAVVTGLVAALAVRTITESVLDDVRLLQDGLDAVRPGGPPPEIVTAGRDELAALAAGATAMAQRVVGAEQARRELLAAVSHDLRTPITSLRLIADAVHDDILEPDARRAYLDRLGLHVGALSALIDDLFELSRLEAGEVEWAMRQVALGMLVADTVDLMHAQADAKGVTLRSAVPDGLPPARGNPEQLQRVLFNLIQNAIRHTPADGSVTIRAETGTAGLEVEIADTGEGIASADRGRVFDAFFQGGRRAARGDGGAGLGLSIARAIVEAHGGMIWLEDAARGARVRFSLPT